MSETWAKIKSSFQEHPWLWAAGVFVVGVLIIYYLFRKPAAAPSGTSDVQAYYQAATAATASGNQLQQTQVAATAATQASANNLTAQLADIAAQSHIADITAQLNSHIADISQQANLQTAQLQANTTVALAQIGSETALGQSQIAQTGSDYTSLLGAFNTQQALEAQVLQNAIGGITTASVSAPNYEQAVAATQGIGSVLSSVIPQISTTIDNPSALLATRYIPGIDVSNIPHSSGVPLSNTTLASLGFAAA